jgi:hypothetical protein
MINRVIIIQRRKLNQFWSTNPPLSTPPPPRKKNRKNEKEKNIENIITINPCKQIVPHIYY